MTKREQQILELIRLDSMISQQSIAGKLGISRSAVAGHIMNLTNAGFIKGRGYIIDEAQFVVAIGGANIDIHGKPTSTLQPHDSNPGTVTTSPGGVARNIAENLARFGTDCRLISAIGSDPYGQLLLRRCREAGLNVRHIQQFADVQTSTYLSVLDDAGNMQVAVNDMAVIEKLDPDRLQSLSSTFKQAALIVLDTNLRQDSLEWITNAYSDRPIFIDTVSAAKAPRIESLLANVHTLKMNRVEAETLSGIDAGTHANRRKIANWAHSRGLKRLFITLGKRGVFYSSDDKQGIEKTHTTQRRPKNADGAGDAFMAGIVYASLQDWALVKSVRFALAAADMTLSDCASSSTAISLAGVQQNYETKYAI